MARSYWRPLVLLDRHRELILRSAFLAAQAVAQIVHQCIAWKTYRTVFATELDMSEWLKLSAAVDTVILFRWLLPTDQLVNVTPGIMNYAKLVQEQAVGALDSLKKLGQ
jgi:hypothetical protein